MKMREVLLAALIFALPATSQTVPSVTTDGTLLMPHLNANGTITMIAPPPDRTYLFSDDCLYINEPFYMCDEVNTWETLELPEDLQGVGFQFEGGITATVEIMASVWVGLQVRAQRYSTEGSDLLLPEELATIDGFPVTTHIQLKQQNGEDVVVSLTRLLLYRVSLYAETMQLGSTYTSEHAARHAEMLAGITHEWSFD
ncbi:MAG: hypothetical protein COB08_009985 [Rhodobacteraceae bacterium]|nr:hypothetical protein [Paracoccaceae bacterium]